MEPGAKRRAIYLFIHFKHLFMQSTIRIDFADLDGSGIQPILRIKAITTDDPRDQLIKTLFQGDVPYLQVQFTDHKHRTSEEGLPIMDKTIICFRPKGSIDTKTHNAVHNNSFGFRDFLNSKNIEFIPNEHFTMIPVGVDLFRLGGEYELYKSTV